MFLRADLIPVVDPPIPPTQVGFGASVMEHSYPCGSTNLSWRLLDLEQTLRPCKSQSLPISKPATCGLSYAGFVTSGCGGQ